MGALACVASAVAFGLLAVFAKLAYGEGVGLDALLLVRFGAAGALLLAVAAGSGRLRGLRPRVVVGGLAMGAIGYAAQSGLYLAALGRVEASQVALLFCGYPLLVMVAAVITRRESPSRRRGAALVLALVGVGLVLGGAPAGDVDLLGAACAIGSAVVYTVYILVGDRVAAPDPLAFAALVCCGAFGTFATWTSVHGAPDLGFGRRRLALARPHRAGEHGRGDRAVLRGPVARGPDRRRPAVHRRARRHRRRCGAGLRARCSRSSRRSAACSSSAPSCSCSGLPAVRCRWPPSRLRLSRNGFRPAAEAAAERQVRRPGLLRWSGSRPMGVVKAHGRAATHHPRTDVMIILTRLNGERFALNPDLLERVDSTPDTVLTLLGGTKYVVSESMELVIERVREFRAGVISASHVPLGLVPDLDEQDDDDLSDVAGAVPLRPRRRS